MTALVKVRMTAPIIYGPERKRLERGQEYDVPNSAVNALVPRYAELVKDDDRDVGTAEGVDLAVMTVAELKAFATEHGIELSASRKADIIAEIEATLGA